MSAAQHFSSPAMVSSLDQELVYMEGWMVKQGRMVRSWKLRYFVLHGSVLEYFDTEEKSKLRGCVRLDSCTVKLVDSHGKEVTSMPDPEASSSTRGIQAGDGARASDAGASTVPHLELVTENRKLVFTSDDAALNWKWKAAFENKISILRYVKKAQAVGQKVDHRLVLFSGDAQATSLVLDDTPMTLEAAVAVVHLIENHNSLTTVRIQDAAVGDLECQVIADALRTNRQVVALHLDGNQIGVDGFKSLASVLHTNRSLHTLSLNDNMGGDDGLAALAEALLQNPTLTNVAVGGNGITDDGARTYAETLIALAPEADAPEAGKGSSRDSFVVRLTEIRLANNDITEIGAKFLADACCINTTVSRVELQWNSIPRAEIETVRASFLRDGSGVRILELEHNRGADDRANSDDDEDDDEDEDGDCEDDAEWQVEQAGAAGDYDAIDQHVKRIRAATHIELDGSGDPGTATGASPPDASASRLALRRGSTMRRGMSNAEMRAQRSHEQSAAPVAPVDIDSDVATLTDTDMTTDDEDGSPGRRRARGNTVEQTKRNKQSLLHQLLKGGAKKEAAFFQSDTNAANDSGNESDTGSLFGDQVDAQEFHSVLVDNTAMAYFKLFLASEYSEENAYFWEAVEQFRHGLHHFRMVDGHVLAIVDLYIKPSSLFEINVISSIKSDIMERLAQRPLVDPLTIFDAAQAAVAELMRRDSYSRFLRSRFWKHYQEASRRTRPEKTRSQSSVVTTHAGLARSTAPGASPYAHKRMPGDYLNYNNNFTIQKILARYSQEVIMFADYADKVNNRGRRQPRVVVITDLAVYNIHPKNLECKRRIPLREITCLTYTMLQDDDFFILNMESGNNYLYGIARKFEAIATLTEQYRKLVETPFPAKELVGDQLGAFVMDSGNGATRPDSLIVWRSLLASDQKKKK